MRDTPDPLKHAGGHSMCGEYAINNGGVERKAFPGPCLSRLDNAKVQENNDTSVQARRVRTSPEDDESLLRDIHGCEPRYSGGKRTPLRVEGLRDYEKEPSYGAYAEFIRGEFEVEYPNQEYIQLRSVMAPRALASIAQSADTGRQYDRTRNHVEERQSCKRNTSSNYERHRRDGHTEMTSDRTVSTESRPMMSSSPLNRLMLKEGSDGKVGAGKPQR